MSKMNRNEFRDIFEHRPLFTAKQVAAMLGHGYSRVYLDRLMKKGAIVRIGKGIYSFHEDPMVYASHLIYPSYVSFSQAMQFHGLTTQVPRLVEVVAPVNGSYPGVELVGSDHVWGYQRSIYDGFELFIASKEKLAIDGVLHERLTMEDIGTILRSCDRYILEDMTLRLGKADMKRVGHASEINGFSLDRVWKRLAGDRNYVRSMFYQGPNRWRVRG